jgi:uncharacterized protein YjbJ (UPF0337 family)
MKHSKHKGVLRRSQLTGGSARKTVGKATNNRSLQAKGSVQKAKGSVQDVAGKVQKKVGGAVKKK